MKNNNIKKYLIDFVVIVLGITVSFWFNELSINKSDEKERQKVLENIEMEIFELKKYCSERLNAWNDDVVLYSKLLENSLDIESIKKITSSKSRIEFNLIYYRDFEPPMNRYNSMINSGNIKFIKSEKIKETLTRLHKLNYSNLKSTAEYEKSLKEDLIKIITENHPEIIFAINNNKITIEKYAELLHQIIQKDDRLRANLNIQMKYFRTRISLLKLYSYTLEELENFVKNKSI
tara:strand:- start:7 stop:708 length:702 start_codon:yes stop_codon:yes gene_type:complete